MAKPNLVIAFGGISPEHEVSVLTALQAVSALKDRKYNLVPLYIAKNGTWLTGDVLFNLDQFEDLERLERQCHPCTFVQGENGEPLLQEIGGGLLRKKRSWQIYAVLTAFHGADGESGSFQGACEMFNIPYTGPDVTGSAVGMDKRMAKDICRNHGFNVVDHVWFNEQYWIEQSEEILAWIKKLELPVFIKPIHLGSSIGVKRVSDEKQLAEAIETAFRYDFELIVEQSVQPLTEINCSVLGDALEARPSVCEQPLGREELLSFEDKYLSGGDAKAGMDSAERHIPAPIDERLSERIRETAVRIFHALGTSGVARLDFLLNHETGEFYFNEINTIPGSFSYYMWEETGLSFPKLLEELVEIGLKRHRIKTGRIRSYETNLLSQKAVQGLKGLKTRES